MGQIRSTLVYQSHIPIAQGRRTLYTVQGYIGIVLRNKMNNRGQWEAGFVASRGEGTLLLPQNYVSGLSETMSQQGIKTLLRNKLELCLICFIRRIVWLGDLSYWKMGRETCNQASWLQMSRQQHIILILGLTPYRILLLLFQHLR